MVTEAYKLGALGLTMEEIADFWNIGRNTLWRYCKSNPELEMELNRGRTEADMTVVQALMKAIKDGNVTGAIFWLKNRRGHEWSDMKQINLKGAKGTTVNVDNRKTIIFSDVDDDLDEIYGDNEERGSQVYATESPEGNRLK